MVLYGDVIFSINTEISQMENKAFFCLRDRTVYRALN